MPTGGYHRYMAAWDGPLPQVGDQPHTPPRRHHTAYGHTSTIPIPRVLHLPLPTQPRVTHGLRYVAVTRRPLQLFGGGRYSMRLGAFHRPPSTVDRCTRSRVLIATCTGLLFRALAFPGQSTSTQNITPAPSRVRLGDNLATCCGRVPASLCHDGACRVGHLLQPTNSLYPSLPAAISSAYPFRCPQGGPAMPRTTTLAVTVVVSVTCSGKTALLTQTPAHTFCGVYAAFKRAGWTTFVGTCLTPHTPTPPPDDIAPISFRATR